jgi:RHS repeat-associated protein
LSWATYFPAVSGSAAYENRDYAYDGSGNIVGISSTRGLAASYLYDSRNRLIQDQLPGRSYNPETREYDGFGNLVRVVGASYDPITTDRWTNRLASSLASYDAAGRMTEDIVAGIGRVYFPDGALLDEFSHLPGSPETLYPNGVSIWMVDGRGENALSFWGDGQYCHTEQFRSFLRDESAKLLTEYRGETEAPCVCSTPCTYRDRFYRDTVRLSPWAKASYTRGVGVRLEALDHLGSPRHVTDALGTSVQTVLLDSFGNPLTGAPATREVFTGHERNHISDDGPYLGISDYMHARTYVPKMGRFTRPDPVDSFSVLFPQGLNRYTYVANNPLVLVDQSGKNPAGVVAGASVGGVAAKVASRAAQGAVLGALVRVAINYGIKATLNPKQDVTAGVAGSAVTGAITGGASAEGAIAKVAANVVGVTAGGLINGLIAGHSREQLKADFQNGVAAGLVSGLADSLASARAEAVTANIPSEMALKVDFATGVLASTTVSAVQEPVFDYLQVLDEAVKAMLHGDGRGNAMPEESLDRPSSNEK